MTANSAPAGSQPDEAVVQPAEERRHDDEDSGRVEECPWG